MPRSRERVGHGRTDEGFARSFNDIKKVETNIGQVEYVDLWPENAASDCLPIMVVGGWSIGRNSLHDFGKDIYNNQRRSLIVDWGQSLGGRRLHETNKRLQSRAESLIRVLDDAGIEKVNAVAHSEGALFVARVAHDCPERFDSLVLAMPAGLIGDDSVTKLTGRYLPKLARSLTRDTIDNPSMGTSINSRGSAYMVKHPAESAKRVKDLAGASINELLPLLKLRGVKVGVIQANADNLFPPKRLGEHVRPTGPMPNVDSYASLIDKKAGHDQLMIKSEPSAQAVIQVLDSLGN